LRSRCCQWHFCSQQRWTLYASRQTAWQSPPLFYTAPSDTNHSISSHAHAHTQATQADKAGDACQVDCLNAVSVSRHATRQTTRQSPPLAITPLLQTHTLNSFRAQRTRQGEQTWLAPPLSTCKKKHTQAHNWICCSSCCACRPRAAVLTAASRLASRTSPTDAASATAAVT
jgi:hypothetical protein